MGQDSLLGVIPCDSCTKGAATSLMFVQRFPSFTQVQTLIDRGSYLLIHPDTKRPVDADDPSTYPCNDAGAQAKAKVGPLSSLNLASCLT
jgi:hypothetical protein